MPNTDWWRGHAGPEQGKRFTWQKIEPGYYRLRGTDIYIANMQGTSVAYSGLVINPWHVRLEPSVKDQKTGAKYGEIARVGSMKEAKAQALQYAQNAQS